MIDARAAVDPQAILDDGVSVGPYSVIGPEVRIGAGTEIGPHVVIRGPTKIGRDNRIYQFASVGEVPQDMKYAGEPTRLEIGDRNQIREFVTIHRGTVQDQSLTRIGNDNLIMAYVHVAHDCRVGDHVVMANAASLGGHVRVDDWAILGGFTLVHQFCRIGAHCFTGMSSVISKDIPPYLMVGGHPAKPHGINVEGLKRRAFADEDLLTLKDAYKRLYRHGLKLAEARLQLAELAASQAVVRPLVDFLDAPGRGIIR